MNLPFLLTIVIEGEGEDTMTLCPDLPGIDLAYIDSYGKITNYAVFSLSQSLCSHLSWRVTWWCNLHNEEETHNADIPRMKICTTILVGTIIHSTDSDLELRSGVNCG